MSDWMIGLIGGVAVPTLLFLWQLILKRERVRRWGKRCGVFLRVFFRQRAKFTGGDQVTERLATTAIDFIDGMAEGLRVSGASD